MLVKDTVLLTYVNVDHARYDLGIDCLLIRHAYDDARRSCSRGRGMACLF